MLESRNERATPALLPGAFPTAGRERRERGDDSLEASPEPNNPMPRMPQSWVAYGLCGARLLFHALDAASVPAVFALQPLLVLAIVVAGAVEVGRLRERWKTSRWRSIVPIAVCAASVLSGGPALRVCMIGRLVLQRGLYDAEADSICGGRPDGEFRVGRTRLGYWSGAVHGQGHNPATSDHGAPAGPIVAADFLTVTHGFPGHAGYLRLCNGIEESSVFGPDGRAHVWQRHRAAFGRWYLVFD